MALAGNRTALRAGRRFLDMDLNRAWRDGAVGRVSGEAKRTRLTGAERQERAELLEALDAALAGDGSTYVLDLHTTSGPGGVITTASDTIRNRSFAGEVWVVGSTGSRGSLRTRTRWTCWW